MLTSRAARAVLTTLIVILAIGPGFGIGGYATTLTTAQQSGRVEGTVVDQTGARVSAARVILQSVTGDSVAETSTDNLAGLLRRVAEASTREVDSLIGDLQALRRKLNTDGNRIQREIAEYAELSQQVMQLANIISESVKKLPTVPGLNR